MQVRLGMSWVVFVIQVQENDGSLMLSSNVFVTVRICGQTHASIYQCLSRKYKSPEYCAPRYADNNYTAKTIPEPRTEDSDSRARSLPMHLHIQSCPLLNISDHVHNYQHHN